MAFKSKHHHKSQIANHHEHPEKEAKFSVSENNEIKHKHPRKEPDDRAKEIEKGLRAIYKDDNGKIPDMSNLEFKKKNTALKIVIWIILALAVILGIAFLGFLVFNSAPGFSEERVNLDIKGPFEAISGENIDYTITISNKEKTGISHLQLTVNLPPGFIFKTSSLTPEILSSPTTGETTALVNTNNTNEPLEPVVPVNSSIKTWKIDDLLPGAVKELEISGQIIGQKDNKQNINATLTYIPANFSSQFEKNQSFSTNIADSSIDLKLEYPNQAANQEDAVITLTLNNTSETIDINNAQIEFNYPPEFTLSSTKIIDQNNAATEETEKPLKKDELKPSQKIIPIEKLYFNTQKQIIFKGKADVTESQKISLNVKLKLKGPTEEYYIQKDENIEIEIIKGELLTALIINGSNQNKPVNFDDTLNYLINIQNKSKNILGDVKIRAVVDSPLLNWATLQDNLKGVREGNQILWTKDQLPDLGVLLPESDVQINFQIKLFGYDANKRYKPEDFKVSSFFEAQINLVNNAEAEIVNSSSTLINEINTNLSLGLNGRYFDDNNSTIGAGPIPPIVGQKTTYKIFLTLNNSLHDINNIEVKTKLPSYISFENQNKTTTGDLKLNQNNEVVWQIGRIPATVTNSTAEFDISLRPTSQDVDKILTLISQITLSATDAQTGGLINKSIQGLTTNLDTDPLAKGKGLIEAE